MVLYWSVDAPRTGGIALGFFAGLALDVSRARCWASTRSRWRSSPTSAVREHQSIRSKPAIQQAMFVLLALVIYELVLFMIDGWTGHPVTSRLRWVHAVTGALIWPPAAALLAYAGPAREATDAGG